MVHKQKILSTNHFIRFDLGNFCNLKCPSCFRQAQTKLWNKEHPYLSKPVKKHPYLDKTHVTLDQVTNWFPEDFMRKRIGTLVFNGASSEPTLNPEFMEILNYFHDLVPNIEVSTHGSTRNEDWWYNLGKTKIYPLFSIDTLTPGNELYRIGANTEKIKKNIRAFAAGGGKGAVKLILFKHNQHEIGAFREFCKEIGQDFSIRPSYDFSGDKTSYEVTNDGRTYTLEKNTTEDLQRNQPRRLTDPDPNSFCHLTFKKMIIIHCNGLVYPCCHIEGEFFRMYERYFTYENPSPKPRKYNERLYDDIVSKIEQQGGITTLSLKHHTLEEVMTSPFFDHVLQDSWADGSNQTCLNCKTWKAEKTREKFSYIS